MWSSSFLHKLTALPVLSCDESSLQMKLYALVGANTFFCQCFLWVKKACYFLVIMDGRVIMLKLTLLSCFKSYSFMPHPFQSLFKDYLACACITCICIEMKSWNLCLLIYNVMQEMNIGTLHEEHQIWLPDKD